MFLKGLGMRKKKVNNYFFFEMLNFLDRCSYLDKKRIINYVFKIVWKIYFWFICFDFGYLKIKLIF